MYSSGTLTLKMDIKTLDEPKVLEYLILLAACVLKEYPSKYEVYSLLQTPGLITGYIALYGLHV